MRGCHRNCKIESIWNGLTKLNDASSRSATVRHETGGRYDVSIRAGEDRLQCMRHGRMREG